MIKNINLDRLIGLLIIAITSLTTPILIFLWIG